MTKGKKERFQKHIRLTKRDQANLIFIKRKESFSTENRTVRAALNIAAKRLGKK